MAYLAISTLQTPFLFTFYVNPGPNRWIFNRLWIMQYSFHWMFTFWFPRNVNLFKPRACRKLANTGSAVPILLLYINRPRSGIYHRCLPATRWISLSDGEGFECIVFPFQRHQCLFPQCQSHDAFLNAADGTLHLLLLLIEFRFCSAPFLGGIGRHFTTVDGKHIFANELHLVANQKNISKEA